MDSKAKSKRIARAMLDILEQEDDLTVEEAVEIAVNVYGFVMHEAGATVHDAVGGAMQYYKQNANNR